MQTQVDAGYGAWRLRLTPTLVAVMVFLVFPWISILTLFLGAVVYASLKLMESDKAFRVLPGPLVIIDIIVEDAKAGLLQARQHRLKEKMLARYGPEIEYF